jgi:hypothetical protein
MLPPSSPAIFRSVRSMSIKCVIKAATNPCGRTRRLVSQAEESLLESISWISCGRKEIFKKFWVLVDWPSSTKKTQKVFFIGVQWPCNFLIVNHANNPYLVNLPTHQHCPNKPCGIRTRIFCSSGGSDDHFAKPLLHSHWYASINCHTQVWIVIAQVWNVVPRNKCFTKV